MHRLEYPGQSFIRELQSLLFPSDPYRSFLEGVRAQHSLDLFDLTILIPYFIILGILAIYGLHRYQLVYLYFRNRDRKPQLKQKLAKLPVVTVQLPIYNELFVVERLIESVTKLDYPRDLLEIQVLDDSNDETRFLARQCVERFRQAGFDIHYLHRQDRQGYKAGGPGSRFESGQGRIRGHL